jgi:hypothetical protein
MKRTLMMLTMISAAVSARADLVIREQADFGSPGELISITYKIHGDKVRQDLAGPDSGDLSVIKDAGTGDTLVLMRQQKLFTKPAPQSRDTQDPDAALSKPLDTGKSDEVGGYDAQIYAWAADRKLWNDTNGMIQTLWVAKDYKNYDKIKPYLAVLDRANVAFPGKGMQPGIGTLPGMVVKSRLLVKMGGTVRTVTIMLISAQEEPVDPSVFEAPADYKEWTPPPPTGQPAPATTPGGK